MAQSKISLDTAALRSSAAQVKGIAGNLENELHSLEQIIASTANAWEGSAKDSFERTFQTTYKKNLVYLRCRKTCVSHSISYTYKCSVYKISCEFIKLSLCKCDVHMLWTCSICCDERDVYF